jgi:DNA end-binding protein Ku
MAKSFWKGVISFGIVTIPVRMYVATHTKPVSFHVLHKKCLTRAREEWYCEKDDEYFTNDQTLKGYEYAKNQYMVMNDEDFDKVPLKTQHAVDILAFVEAAEVDPVYYHQSYYLEPEDIGAKPFALLRQVMVKMGRVGIAKVAFQKREHLCTLRPLGNALALHTMYYRDEVLPVEEVAPGKQEVTASELTLAETLVKTLAGPFKPELYKDEYREALRKVVDAKLKGVELKAPKAPKAAPSADLMKALRESVEIARKREKEKVAV